MHQFPGHLLWYAACTCSCEEETAALFPDILHVEFISDSVHELHQATHETSVSTIELPGKHCPLLLVTPCRIERAGHESAQHFWI